MVEKKFLEALKNDVLSLRLDDVKTTAEEAMDAGINPVTAITEGLAVGLRIIGDRFEKRECFLSELILAAETMKEGMSVIQPYIKEEVMETKGRVIVATVEGDNHDIGKSLVATLLRVSGFDVIDLGIDVSTETIIEEVKKHRPDILGLSALLTVTMPKMGDVINRLEGAGIREDVKVIVGGSPVTKEFANKIGADYSSTDAVDGVNKCIEWVS
jgi:5-methyltetrahydrofolate--homocysteine methyltransferase